MKYYSHNKNPPFFMNNHFLNKGHCIKKMLFHIYQF
jgi:hypothetical protein